MTEEQQTTQLLAQRRKSAPLGERPFTSYIPASESVKSLTSSFTRSSIHLSDDHRGLYWSFQEPDYENEPSHTKEPVYVDPFMEHTLTSTAKLPADHIRHHSTLAQSFRSGFSAIGRRMSQSLRNGKDRIRTKEDTGDSRRDMTTLFTTHKRKSQMLDLSEASTPRPRTRGFLNSLASRRRPSMPLLNLHSQPQRPQLSAPQSFDPYDSQTNSSSLVRMMPNYVAGGEGARASAAAQNEAMMAMRGTPLPTYHAATTLNSDISDSESGIGISVDHRRDSAVTHVSRCDPMEFLATELVEQILSYLDAKSLLNAGLVSKRWATLSQSQHVWREVFYKEYAGGLPRRISSRQPIPGMGKNIAGQDFRKLYEVRTLIDRRWANGEAAAVYLNGHKDSVYCVQFDENKIITGSRDNTIRIWDARTYQCIRKLSPPNNARERHHIQRPEVEPVGIIPIFKSEASSPEPKPVPLDMWHQASVLCLQYDEEILVTGSSDFSCIVWSIKDNYKPIRQLVGHQAGVLDVCIDSKRIITCSKDTTIKIWDRRTGRLMKTLTGHRGPVNAVQVRGNLLASASGDGMSKLWRLEDGLCIKEFHSRERGLACVEFSEDGRTIFAGGNDHVIYEYNTVTGNIERELEGHKSLVRSLHLDTANERIISGSYDHSIKVWDSKKGKNLEDGGLKINLEGWTSSWMLAAKSNYRKIACASQDGRVVIIDFGYGIDGVHLVEA